MINDLRSIMASLSQQREAGTLTREQHRSRVNELLAEYPTGALYPVIDDLRRKLREQYGWSEERIAELEESVVEKAMGRAGSARWDR